MEKTDAVQLKWEEGSKKATFRVSFPEYTILLSIRPCADSPEDDYYISIFNSEGTLIEETSDRELATFIPNAYQQMQSLYDKARRQALGVDKAIDNILENLK